MKALILGLLMSAGINDNENKAVDYSSILEEMTVEKELALELHLEERKIRIFDINGNLKNAYLQEEFIKNELPLTDLKDILESEFLFEYQGNSYYLINH